MPLADLQRDFACALLAGDPPPFATHGVLSAAEALRIHRNTVLGALAGALRLSHPTVDMLVGEAFFDRAAGLFGEAHPPRGPSLALYGEGFADFLAAWPPAMELPYLADVARLDFAIDRAMHSGTGWQRFPLDASAAIELPSDLRLLLLRHPADEIRTAMGDDAALGRIDLSPREIALLVWRKDQQAVVRRIGPASARFLAVLQAGAPATAALAAASPGAETLTSIQQDIFAAPFCRVIANQEITP